MQRGQKQRSTIQGWPLASMFSVYMCTLTHMWACIHSYSYMYIPYTYTHALGGQIWLLLSFLCSFIHFWGDRIHCVVRSPPSEARGAVAMGMHTTLQVWVKEEIPRRASEEQSVMLCSRCTFLSWLCSWANSTGFYFECHGRDVGEKYLHKTWIRLESRIKA